jgi:hypothetical protein
MVKNIFGLFMQINDSYENKEQKLQMKSLIQILLIQSKHKAIRKQMVEILQLYVNQSDTFMTQLIYNILEQSSILITYQMNSHEYFTLLQNLIQSPDNNINK